MAGEYNLARRVFHFFAGRDTNLRLNEIDVRNQFGHGMFDLNARVHFDEIDLAGLVHQKFNRAGVGVTDILERLHNSRAQFLPALRIHSR